MSCKVLLADDHQIILDGLCALLKAQPDIEVVGTAHDGREALRLVQEARPDVVVLDISMREMNGIDAALRIKAEHANVKILCLSMHSGPDQVAAMLRAGATGYLLKEDASAELVQAIHTVWEGDSFLSTRVASSVIEMVQSLDLKQPNSSLAKLTVREREVLQLLAEGYSSREIAVRLHLSIRTVGSHRENVKKKLNIHTTAGLTRYAISNGLTPFEG